MPPAARTPTLPSAANARSKTTGTGANVSLRPHTSCRSAMQLTTSLRHLAQGPLPVLKRLSAGPIFLNGQGLQSCTCAVQSRGVVDTVLFAVLLLHCSASISRRKDLQLIPPTCHRHLGYAARTALTMEAPRASAYLPPNVNTRILRACRVQQYDENRTAPTATGLAQLRSHRGLSVTTGMR